MTSGAPEIGKIKGDLAGLILSGHKHYRKFDPSFYGSFGDYNNSSWKLFKNRLSQQICHSVLGHVVMAFLPRVLLESIGTSVGCIAFRNINSIL